MPHFLLMSSKGQNVLFMMWCHSCGNCIINDIVNACYPCQFLFLELVSLDRGVTTVLVYSFITLNFFHCRKCSKKFWKTLAETALTTSGAEPEPGTSTSTEPSASFPPQVLITHHQHMADYRKLMMEIGMDLTMGEDRAAPLITEVCSPMPTPYHTSTSKSILNFLYSQSHTLFPFYSRPYRRFD